MSTQQIAEAFSRHRFTETYDHLAAHVRWVLPGQATIEGRNAVVAARNSSAAEMAHLAIYEFDDDGLVTTMTSYTVELDT
jgi:hypothetical protein